jgi:photosystem II stability/assembly factor-like uncharacterized protein
LLLRFRAAVAGLAIAIHAPLCLPGADTLPRRAAEGLLLSEVEFPPVASAPIDFAVDSAGAIYVAASITESQRESWEIRAKGQAQLGTGAGPVAVPCGPFPPIKRDIFVAKVSPDGRQLDYLKFLGGAGDDLAAAIAVDGAGRAVVTGYTDSRDFPGVEGGSSAKNLGRDVFVLELSADGSQVVRATLLGGNDRDEAHDIAIDASNAIYIAGETVSPDFPARNSLPRSPAKGGMLRSGNGGVTWLESNGGLVERRIRAIVPDARQEGVVYAVTNAGLFRSVDAGASWQAASQSLGPEVVLTVAVDPQDSSILYTGTENGVFKTVDAGTTWFSLSAGLVGNSLRVTHIAIDPAGVFKSSDGGRNWVLLPLNQAETRALALDPGNPSTLYVSQFTPGTCGFLAIPARSTLVKSTDGGATFESVLGQIGEGENFFKPVIHGLAVNPVDSMNLYAATSKGVFRSGDGGANWLLRNEGLPGGDGSGQQVPREARAVVIDPSNPSTVYALLSGATQVRGEVFASHDAGATWQRVDFGAGEGITAFAADPKNSARLYAGTAEHPGQDGFVAKLAPGSRSLEFSTILGGSGVDAAWFVAADASGYAYVGGQTQSDDFPVAGAFQSRRAGEDEIFLAKVAVDGASLAY